jgi:hypothetical protein
MSKREVPPNAHEIAKLESKMFLLYFLRDIGIKSATEAASDFWDVYVVLLSHLSVGG